MVSTAQRVNRPVIQPPVSRQTNKLLFSEFLSSREAPELQAIPVFKTELQAIPEIKTPRKPLPNPLEILDDSPKSENKESPVTGTFKARLRFIFTL